MVKNCCAPARGTGRTRHGCREKKLGAAPRNRQGNTTPLAGRAVAGARPLTIIFRGNPYQSIGVAFGVGMLIGYSPRAEND